MFFGVEDLGGERFKVLIAEFIFYFLKGLRVEEVFEEMFEGFFLFGVRLGFMISEREKFSEE